MTEYVTATPDDIADAIASAFDGDWHDGLEVHISATAREDTVRLTATDDGGAQTRFSATVTVDGDQHEPYATRLAVQWHTGEIEDPNDDDRARSIVATYSSDASLVRLVTRVEEIPVEATENT